MYRRSNNKQKNYKGPWFVVNAFNHSNSEERKADLCDFKANLTHVGHLYKVTSSVHTIDIC